MSIPVVLVSLDDCQIAQDDTSSVQINCKVHEVKKTRLGTFMCTVFDQQGSDGAGSVNKLRKNNEDDGKTGSSKLGGLNSKEFKEILR